MTPDVERQHERIGPRREFPNCQMGQQHQRREPEHVDKEARRNVPVQAEADGGIGKSHDDDGEAEHRDLGAAPAPGQRDSAARRAARRHGHIRRGAHRVAGGREGRGRIIDGAA